MCARNQMTCPFKYTMMQKMLVGCYGRKIHPVYSIQHIPKITKVIFCHLPCRKTDLKVEMPLSFLMKACALGNIKQKHLLSWQLYQQFIGSFFISSIRETPLMLYGHHHGDRGLQHKG